MLGIGPGTRVMVTTRPVDYRKGPDALAVPSTEVTRIRGDLCVPRQAQ